MGDDITIGRHKKGRAGWSCRSDGLTLATIMAHGHDMTSYILRSMAALFRRGVSHDFSGCDACSSVVGGRGAWLTADCRLSVGSLIRKGSPATVRESRGRINL